jgi:pyruvate/2-oxoacid:ferredoxin oxidoreductase beta subunit
MKEAITHHGFAFLNVISPCVTWRGDDQMKLLRPKVRPVPADHVRTDREAAMRFTNEDEDRLTVGVLFASPRASLLDEMIDIRERASGVAMPPGREEILRAFA